MTRKLTKMIYAVVIALSMSCSKNEDNNDNSQPLYWEIDEQRFTAEGGKAFDNGASISVYVTPHPSNCSSKVYEYDNYLNVEIPKNADKNEYNVVFGRKGSIPMNALNSNYLGRSKNNFRS